MRSRDVTLEIAKIYDAQGMNKNTKAAKAGGKIAGEARTALEKKMGRTVVLKQNYKQIAKLA